MATSRRLVDPTSGGIFHGCNQLILMGSDWMVVRVVCPSDPGSKRLPGARALRLQAAPAGFDDLTSGHLSTIFHAA